MTEHKVGLTTYVRSAAKSAFWALTVPGRGHLLAGSSLSKNRRTMTVKSSRKKKKQKNRSAVGDVRARAGTTPANRKEE